MFFCGAGKECSSDFKLNEKTPLVAIWCDSESRYKPLTTYCERFGSMPRYSISAGVSSTSSSPYAAQRMKSCAQTVGTVNSHSQNPPQEFSLLSSLIKYLLHKIFSGKNESIPSVTTGKMTWDKNNVLLTRVRGHCCSSSSLFIWTSAMDTYLCWRRGND